MGRISFQAGDLDKYLADVQEKLGLTNEQLAFRIQYCSRMVRDWRHGRFNPPEDAIKFLSNISGLPLPKHEILADYWYTRKAGTLGAIKRNELHGLPGTTADRSRGGKESWRRREADPKLLEKYTKAFFTPSISADLAEFIGIMLGDGGMTKYQLTVTLNAEDDAEYTIFVIKLIKKLFHIEPRVVRPIRVGSNNMVNYIIVSRSRLNAYLQSLGLVIGNKVRQQVKIPDWILDSLEYKTACLKGLVDTDGCFFNHNYVVNGKKYLYKKIDFTSRSRPLLDGVMTILKELGFNPAMTKNNVRLNGQQDVIKYLELVGTHNPKHLKRYRS